MEIEQLLKLMEKVSESNLETFSYEEGNLKLHLEKQSNQVVVQASPEMAAAPVAMQPAAAVEPKTPSGNMVESPLVGVFYQAPAEGADPYVSVGDTVKKGQVLGIIEAMKLMNEIECEYDGVVKEILVNNAEAVEYGQPLFVIAGE